MSVPAQPRLLLLHDDDDDDDDDDAAAAAAAAVVVDALQRALQCSGPNHGLGQTSVVALAIA